MVTFLCLVMSDSGSVFMGLNFGNVLSLSRYFWEWGKVSEEWSGPVPVRSCAIGLDTACSSASLISTPMGHFSEVPMLYLPTNSTIADPRLAGISKCMGLGACFDPHASQPSFSCGLASDAILTRREGREPDRNIKYLCCYL